jgi:hypothetical protein
LHGITAVPFSKIFKRYSQEAFDQDMNLPSSEKMIAEVSNKTVSRVRLSESEEPIELP